MNRLFHTIFHFRIFFPAGLLYVMISCRGGGTGVNETPTSGDITISVDESFELLVDSEIKTFTAYYPYAKITADYKPEYDVVSDFMNDSVQMIVSSYKLRDDQIQDLRDQLIVVRTTAFAYDALALVINRENMDSLLRYDVVRDIFQGKITRWKEIDPASELGRINVVFDHTRSGNIRYFKEKFEITENLPDNFYAVESNQEVIDYIEGNPDGLGIVSVNWISDPEDSLSMSFINRIKVAAISGPFLDQSLYYLPYQGSIYDESYPFTREVYAHSRETFTGLGSGFISWLAGEKGQRIVLKSGLVPATMPVRLIQLENQ